MSIVSQVSVVLAISFSIISCGSDSSSSAPPANDSGERFNLAEGKELYKQNCSACHGALEASTKRGTTAEKITAAIANEPGMRGLPNLQSLNQVDIKKIAAVLN